MSSLQVRTRRHGKVKALAQDHRASWWGETWDRSHAVPSVLLTIADTSSLWAERRPGASGEPGLQQALGRAGSLSFPACWLCFWCSEALGTWAEDAGYRALSAGRPSSFDRQMTQWPCQSPGERVLRDSHLLSSPPSSLSPDDSNGLFARGTRVLIKQTLLFRQLWDQEDGQVLPARCGLALIS